VARETGFDILSLEALERDDHGVLPDDDSVTVNLRALARLIDVDPDQVIGDYIRERENYRQAGPTDAAVVRDADEAPDVVMTRPAARSVRSPALLVLGTAVLVLAVAGLLWLRSSARHETTLADPVSRNEVAMVPETTPETSDPQPASVGDEKFSTGRRLAPDDRPPSPMDQAQNAASESPAPALRAERSGLVIPHHGVGIGVENHELIGRADRFAEGTWVWFWTSVEGATPGEEIHHVWLHEGEEVLSVPLKLGGARWRTQSYKNLHPGSAGHWVVEARDEAGHVLARRAFQCFRPTAH
jgi:hypothetical protein